MTASSLSLELEDVALRRGERLLIAGLSFALGAGQMALITGPNGSGKTTLLRALAGLSRPEQGTIRLNGTEIARLEAEQRGLLAYQAHLEGLKKDLTVDENISLISRIRNCSQSYSGILAELGLEALRNRTVGRLSAGQKRRAVLAGLMVSGARVWLLDEPLTNLDQAGRDLVATWLARHLEAGGIAVVATHLASVLERPGSLLVEF